MEEHLRDIISLSLGSSPEKMMERALHACIDISGARGGSILGEEGPYLQFLFADVPELVGKRVPMESIAGATILKGVIIYTFAPKDTRHFKEIDEQLLGKTRYLLSIPIPSIHRTGDQQRRQKNAGALQLLFDNNIFSDVYVDDGPREFEVDIFREDEFCRKHLNGVFLILPNIAFAMEVMKLRQTSYQAIHELKNKLISALSWLDYLKSDIKPGAAGAEPDGGAIKQDMELVESALREGAELAKTYLTLASLYEPRFSDTNLNAVLKEVGAAAQAFGDARQPGALKVVCNLEPSLPVRQLDPEKLKMAFYNLSKNAVEAMLDHGVAAPCLTISSGVENDHIVATVADNGPGMPKEIADNLFIPFKTKKEGGTGLGLTITRKIVDMHGGRIRCGTGTDGTVFTVTI